MENNNKQPNNRLFALEQGLFGHQTSQQPSQQPVAKKRKRAREQARAFDLGEAIELRYNGEAFSTATPEAMSFSVPNSFASELEDESLPFEVEAFEVNREVTPVSKQVRPQPETLLQPEIAEDVTPKPMEVQPAKATVVPPSEQPLKSAHPVKQPNRVEETPSTEELSDAEAFAADLQAILNGEKTYDPEQQQMVPTAPPAPPPAAPTSHPHDIFDGGQTATPTPPQQPAEPPVQMSRSHAVFDQMGKNMAHATDFDQGTVDLALEMRFDEFDRILDQQVQQMTVPDPLSKENHVDKRQEETLEAKAMSMPVPQATYAETLFKYSVNQGTDKAVSSAVMNTINDLLPAATNKQPTVGEIDPIKIDHKADTQSVLKELQKVYALQDAGSISISIVGETHGDTRDEERARTLIASMDDNGSLKPTIVVFERGLAYHTDQIATPIVREDNLTTAKAGHFGLGLSRSQRSMVVAGYLVLRLGGGDQNNIDKMRSMETS
jgi:hypothetical protein